MPLTLTADAGDENANAYATVEEALVYAGYRVGGQALIALNEDNPEKVIQALVTFAMDMDTLENDPGLLGDRITTIQAMAFPRNGVLTIPRDVKRANIEGAISIALLGTSVDADVLNAEVGNGNVKVDKTGPLQTEYFAPSSLEASALERFPAMVQRLMAPFLLSSDPGWGSADVTRSG